MKSTTKYANYVGIYFLVLGCTAFCFFAITMQSLVSASPDCLLFRAIFSALLLGLTVSGCVFLRQKTHSVSLQLGAIFGSTLLNAVQFFLWNISFAYAKIQPIFWNFDSGLFHELNLRFTDPEKFLLLFLGVLLTHFVTMVPNLQKEKPTATPIQATA